MSVTTIQSNLMAAMPRETAALSAVRSPAFPDHLERAQNTLAAQRPEQLQQSAERLVSQALVLPALESLRESGFAEDTPFAPGVAERRFGPLLDQHIADRVVGASNFSLVDSIVQQLGLGDEQATNVEVLA